MTRHGSVAEALGAMNELRAAATESAQDAAELALRARELRTARQRERAQLDGVAIRMLGLLAERPADIAPNPATPEAHQRDLMVAA
jgi:hypothetical protein